jgi:hypothetical protein
LLLNDRLLTTNFDTPASVGGRPLPETGWAASNANYRPVAAFDDRQLWGMDIHDRLCDSPNAKPATPNLWEQVGRCSMLDVVVGLRILN